MSTESQPVVAVRESRAAAPFPGAPLPRGSSALTLGQPGSIVEVPPRYLHLREALMKNYRHVLQWVRIVLLLCYWGLLFIGTHVPGRMVPDELGNDKLMHFTAFAGLSFLLAWVIAPLRPTLRAIGLAALITMSYGAFDEWTQAFVAQRSSEIGDWIADVVGAFVGLCAYMVTWILANGILAARLRATPIPAGEMPLNERV